MKNKEVAAMLGAVMIFTLLFTVIPPVFAVQNTIDISSKKDFIEFSKNCTLDTWSQGKTVNLTCDIDFKGADFSPVPTFGGTFNGNGYMISGIKFHKSGSYIGIFRYIQPEGKITNLNVKAEFAPNGSKCFVGGIVGENHGVLEMCGFDGTVKGQDVIGGIAGNNAEDGQIISGIVGGSIIGENSTGGIAGKNSGFIQNCTNNAAVNTVYEEKKKDISDIDADTGAIIENYKNKAEESEEETILGNSDTGGIVGYSSGIIQGCVNNSGVGYRHIGYNIGGIAGRQSGYMLGCRNYGSVQGRKDVGGIVGQLEPYVLLNVSEGGLKNIRKELNDLNTMVNRFLTDTDNLGTDTEKHLSDISEYSKNARDNAEIMMNQGTGFIDDNIGEINAQSAILSNSFDKLAPVFESLTNSFDDLAAAVDETIKSIDDLETDLPDLSDEHELIKSALRDISRSADSIKKSLSKADKACGDLDDAIKFNNETQARNSVSELQNSLKDIITSKQTIKASLEAIESALRSGPANSESALKQIAESIKTIKENADTEISSLQQIVTNLDDIKNNSETDLSKFGSAARNMKSALQNLGDGLYLLSRGLEKISESAEGIYNKSESLSEEFQTANENLKKSLKSASYACGDIAAATGDIKDIVTDLSDEKPAEFVKLGDDFKTASDGLFNSLSDISDELNKLKKSVSKERNTVVNDLRSVGNQFNLVMNLLIGEFENLQSGTKNASDIFLDVSDEDMDNTKQGKAEECHNYGNVSADRSVGGIAGAMAIEYAKDPEDDIKKPDSLNFTYRTKAILKRCINEGEVTGKKDCAGGIAGLSEIGTIYECQNYADTESTGGDFVGGIAGKSESSIHQSYAKGKVTGKRYIGGIAGKADTVTGCYAIVDVIGDENTGAISGDA
ncbi:MAG: hypothetical protein J5874_04085, partial [Oscillospiraceae bacterium]|nr:hypothetical protein [Oscillospiraceae bacterium]